MTAHAPYRAPSCLCPLAAALSLIPMLAGCPTESDATANDDSESSGSGSSSATAANDAASPDPSTTGGPADSGSTAAEADDTGTTADETTSDDRSDTDSSGGDPSCADEGGLCTLDFPKDWNGPVAMISWADGEEPPECAGGYDITIAGMLSNDLIAPDAVCTCECGNASGGSCEGELDIARTASVNGQCSPFGDEIATIEPNTAVPLNEQGGAAPGGGSVALLISGSSTYGGGSCDPSSTEDLPLTSFANHTSLCAGSPVTGTCEEDTLCMPTAEAPQDTAVCIWQEGDVSCPSGWGYHDRTVAYQDTADDRSCSDCSCGSPSGDCSIGNLVATGISLGAIPFPPGGFFNSALPAACLSVSEATWTVTNLAWNGVGATNDVDCNALGGDPQGEAAAADPITVCCYEPQS